MQQEKVQIKIPIQVYTQVYLFIFDCLLRRRSNTSKIFPFVYPLGGTLCTGGLRMQSEMLSYCESCKQSFVCQLMCIQERLLGCLSLKAVNVGKYETYLLVKAVNNHSLISYNSIKEMIRGRKR